MRRRNEESQWGLNIVRRAAAEIGQTFSIRTRSMYGHTFHSPPINSIITITFFISFQHLALHHPTFFGPIMACLHLLLQPSYILPKTGRIIPYARRTHLTRIASQNHMRIAGDHLPAAVVATCAAYVLRDRGCGLRDLTAANNSHLMRNHDASVCVKCHT